MSYYNINRPALISQPIPQGASSLLGGLQQGMQLANLSQQSDAREQQMQLQQMQIDEAEMQRQIQSIATGAEQIIDAPAEQREQILLNRIEKGRALGRDMSDSVALLEMADQLEGGLSNPQIDEALRLELQEANRLGYFTPKQEIERKVAAENTLTRKDKDKIRMDFRKEFAAQAGKGLLESEEQIKKIRSAKKTGIGDVALMKTINKMIDSGIVTDSDFDQVAQSSGVADSFQGLVNRIIGGGSLNDATREQILDQAELLYNAKAESAKQVAAGIEKDAESYGVSNVIGSRFKKIFDSIPEKQPEPEPPTPSLESQGFILMRDANGNQAYVNQQTGEIREL